MFPNYELKPTRFARMILNQTPLTLTFLGQQQLNISTTICFVYVASVQLFQR